MKALGRRLADPFDAFWRAFSPELPVSADDVERGRSVVFGDQGVERLPRGAAPRWFALPDDDFAYHAAHELTHMLMRERGYPKTARGVGYPPNSAEALVGEELEEMALHPSLHALIEPFGFRREFIQRTMFEGAARGLRSAPPPEYGSPWHFVWAIRHCLLRFELPLAMWRELAELFAARSPAAAALGEELADILLEVGWGSREQALEGLVRARNALALDVQEKVLVIDPVGGEVF